MKPDSLTSRLTELATKWRAEGARVDTFHATMGIGYKVCAEALEAELAAAPLVSPPGPTHFMDGGKPVCESMHSVDDDVMGVTCVACLRILSDRPFPLVDALMEATLEAKPAEAPAETLDDGWNHDDVCPCKECNTPDEPAPRSEP